MSPKKRPKLLDVARNAGVSPATVSRVLNNSAPVRPGVRTQVLASLRSLGYQAHTPRSTSRSTIALLVPDVLNPFFTEIMRGVQEEAGVDGFTPVLLDTVEDPQREARGLKLFLTRPVSGIILCASRLSSDELVAVRGRHRIPFVVINRNIAHPEISCVIVDCEGGGYRAAHHLLELKHTRIAVLKGPSQSEPGQARQRGIDKALGEAGVCLRPEWCFTSFPNADGGFQAMSALLALAPQNRPTAVITYNDIMALGALNAVRAQHLRVPEDISIIGFDDIEMAAHANPPLTTVAQPKYQMGKLAMKILRQMIQGNLALGDGYTLLESPLVVRESTGLAPRE